MDGDRAAQLGYLVLLLLAVGGWVMVEYQGRLGTALRAVLGWALIFVGVMAGYGLWTDLRLERPAQAVMTDSAITIPRSRDGHYYLTLDVQGTPVPFMVDTGATSMVLSRDDAARVGIDLNTLAFLGQARTANGIVRTARVKLDQVTLGPFTDANLRADVNDGDMQGSLLGMEYLRNYRIEIDNDRMVLRR